MSAGWPAVSYDRWGATCDTLHAHTQVLGKLAGRLAPPRPQRQPAAPRVTPRWWGTFDLAVFLFSGRPAEPPSDDFIVRNAADAQLVEVGWWPGDPRHPEAAFFAFAHPAPPGFAHASLSPAAARWDETLGEYVLDWVDVRAAADPHAATR